MSFFLQKTTHAYNCRDEESKKALKTKEEKNQSTKQIRPESIEFSVSVNEKKFDESP